MSGRGGVTSRLRFEGGENIIARKFPARRAIKTRKSYLDICNTWLCNGSNSLRMKIFAAFSISPKIPVCCRMIPIICGDTRCVVNNRHG